MSEDNNPERSARRKRVQTLKKLIIFSLTASILLPIILCIVLFFRVWDLENGLERLSEQLAGIAQELEAVRLQQEQQEPAEEASALQKEEKAMEAPEAHAASETSDTGEMSRHKVYLTFDDGPSVYTEEILDILERYEVKATFFVVGKEDEASKEYFRRIVEEGHTLGMHSYSHKYTDIYQSVDNFAADFKKIQDYLEKETGVRSTYYRFPGGSSNTVSDIEMQEFADYLESQGVTFFDWNVSSGDGGSKLLTVQQLTENSTAGITERYTSIILMHDSAEKSATVEALPGIIENILAMEDTVILPITEETTPIQHIHKKD